MEKHNKILQYLMIGIMIWLAYGCEDMLKVDNQGMLFAEDNFKTGNDVNASILGLYSLLQPASQQVVLYNEVRADLLQASVNADADLLQIEAGEADIDNDYLNPRDFYKVIVSCNDILSKMENVKLMDPSFTETIYAQYYAEVIGVRTWTYFQISKIFGKVEYYTNAVNSIEDKIQATELNAQQSVLKMIDDLSPVMNDFIKVYSSSVSADWRVARFNANAAKMLYAELLMYKGAFDITTLQESYYLASKQLWMVMSADSANTTTQAYKVGSSYEKANWINIFTSLSTSYNEVIWAIDFSKTNEQTHQLHNLFYVNPQLSVTPEASAYFASSDSRTAGSISGAKVRKFSINKTVFQSDAPIVIYRAADLHLLYAEAINRLGDPDLAMKVINIGYSKSIITPTGEKLYNAQSKGIRARAGLTALVLGTTDRQIQADGYIRDERIREMAFEGKRWESLVRYAILDGKTTITVRGISFPSDKWYSTGE
ncbi:MAG: RagB/SusD family nutrient uptake outer membrane protein [Bacteroidales bacterium]|jgi:hypothetical protein|nr:RagB/SusD family nutrient uptake outer membrane protein [Bacteroidales bacterium]